MERQNPLFWPWVSAWWHPLRGHGDCGVYSLPPAVTRECPPARDAVRGTGPPQRRGSPRITASPAWWDWASGLGAAQKWPPPSGRGPLTRETPLPPHYASLHPNPSSHQRPLPAEGVALGAITAGAVPVGSGGATDTGVPGVSPPPRIPHARSPMVAATKNAETGRSHNRFPCMVPLPAPPTACRTCWSRIPASMHGCFRWRHAGRGAGSGAPWLPAPDSRPKEKDERSQLYAEYT